MKYFLAGYGYRDSVWSELSRKKKKEVLEPLIELMKRVKVSLSELAILIFGRIPKEVILWVFVAEFGRILMCFSLITSYLSI